MFSHKLATIVIHTVLVSSVVLLSEGCAVMRPLRSQVPRPERASDRDLIPGDWRRVEALPFGSSVVMTLKSDKRVAGSLKRLDATTITLIIVDGADGSDSQVDRSDISSIVATGVNDGLANGVLTGVGLGAATAGVILAVIGSGDGYVLPSAKAGAPLLLSGAGGLLGAVIDRAHKGDRLVYSATRTPDE